jgi:menaquinone-dependent protoporphyrinogen oxidase
MAPTILVAFATKHGSTREVAEVVAGRLREHDVRTDVLPAADVHGLEPYEAVVLGGALYAGRWHGDARRFLRRHRRALGDRPLAVFALGPLTEKEEDMAGSRAQLDRALGTFEALHPVAVAVFGGVVDPAKLRFPFSHMPATDARDWERIRAWADEVARLTAPVYATL